MSGMICDMVELSLVEMLLESWGYVRSLRMTYDIVLQLSAARRILTFDFTNQSCPIDILQYTTIYIM